MPQSKERESIRSRAAAIAIALICVLPTSASAATLDNASVLNVLTSILQTFSRMLANMPSQASPGAAPEQVAAGGNAALPYAAAQRIDNLSNITVSGVLGLTTSDVPDLSGKYLSITSTSTARSILGLSYASASDVTNSTNIATWGDSLTAGNEDGTGGTYPKSLQALTGYSVYNGGVGGETSTQIKTRMLAANSKYGWPTIIWAGRNNVTNPTTIKSDIAAMVAALTTNNYIILGVLNTSAEASGSTNYNTIVQLNNDLASTYGSHFIDIRAYLVSLYNPGVPQDVTDHGNDIPPSSLRYDTVHLTATGYADVAQKIYQNIAQLQTDSNSQKALTPFSLISIFNSPPPIGSTAQGPGYFSAVGIGTTTPLDYLDVSTSLGLTGSNPFLYARGGNVSTQLNLDFPELTSAAGQIRLLRNTNTTNNANSGLLLYKGDGSTATQSYLNAFGNSYINALAGNVGIGTTTPLDLLDVAGNIGLTNSTARTIYLRGGNAASQINLDFPDLTSNTGQIRLFRNTTTSGNNSTAMSLAVFKGDGSGSIQTNLSAFGNSYINALAGNVGIGTTSPLTKLSVQGTSGANDVLNIASSTGASLLYVNAAGNVGIGTASPLQQLDVEGPPSTNSFIRVGVNGGSTKAGIYLGNAGNTYGELSFNNTGVNVSLLQEFSSGNLILGTNSAEKMRIDSSGNVGIGTTSPTTALQVNGVITPSADNVSSLGNATYRWSSVFAANGTIQTSDARLKSNVSDLSYGLADLLKLRPVSFTWTAQPSQGTQLGFIAQEVQPLFPETVNVGDDADHTLGLTYTEFVPVIVKSIQQLAQQIGNFADSFTTNELTFTRATGTEIDVQKLCIGSTCVTEDQLQTLLNQVGQQPSAPSEPAPSESSYASSTPEVIDAPSIQPEEMVATSTNSQE